MTTRSDIEQLLARTSLGDRAAFSDLYDATSAKLFGICLRVLKNRSEAEDALQDAYVRIWQKSASYAANGYSPMTWLITVTRNLAIDRLRARKDGPADTGGLDNLTDSGPTPEAAAVAASERRQLGVCLDELDDGRAEAVKGAYLDGYSYKELAAHHGVPLNTMRTWLRRSLQKLKECLSR
ncbi:sigma-70 family RNA polymerase sigma factor [Leisingera sp. JC1]|uniref:sigma-70 family RNA polymerase sigma factor n=1 Tax=Leisingera sp. JC1 TaxID=1855282 RepID=UPI0008029C18|nr:sigma-70 family RNA polymerase sigma factor [Leisingera sp. JC1]OBY28510.1 RNA polymerase subunit sigma [Leisingera sp. JC1]